jgi:hypothetical protein
LHLSVLIDASVPFDIIEADNVHRDEQGEVFPDHKAAEVEAIKAAAEMVKHEIGRQHAFDRAIEVRDESDQALFRVRMAAKLELQCIK